MSENALPGSFAVEPLQKLVYSDKIQNPLANLLLVSTEVQEYQQFIDSANPTTFAVAYSRMSSKMELMELLRSKTQSLKRIGFVFHSPGNNEKTFLDGKSFFLANELANDSDNSDDYSENLQWLLDVISEFGVKNVDYLACDTLNNDLWKSYYDFLTEKTGISVGASNNKTGNLKYGGDWIMESTGEDVERVYFTESIEYYKYLLVTIDPVDGVTYGQIGVTLTASVSSANNGTILANTTILSSVTDTDGAVYTVVSIANLAFIGCTNLTSVTVPSSVTTIGQNSFNGCSNLINVNLETGIQTIGNYAFGGCTSLSSFTIPTSVTTIGTNPFNGCSSLSLIFAPGSQLTTINAGIFDNSTSFTSIILPSNLQIIGSNAFSYCNALKSISIPSSVTTYGFGVFYGCTGLTSLTIQTGLTIIGNSAFQGCTSLTSVYFDSLTNLPSLGSNCFVQNLDPSTNTAYYYDNVNASDGAPIANYPTYFASYGFANALVREPEPTPAPIVCFKEGSRILTKNGYRYIQDLRKGDLIKTVLHNYVPIAMIGKRDIYHPAKKDRIKDQLYKCTSEKYPEVFEELVITGCHSILVDQFASQEQREKTMEVNKIKMACVTEGKYRLPACVDDRASVYEKPGNYTIYHLALENPDYYMNYGIYANGLLVETCSKRYLKELSNMTLID